MKHIRQGYAECKLATIAMLAGVSLSEIRSLALFIANVKSWHLTIDAPNEIFKHTVVKLISLYHLEGKVINGFDLAPIIQTNATSSKSLRKYKSNETLPLSGKGEIFIMWKKGFAHSVAYEDNIIFDPSESKEYPIDEWLNLPSIKGEVAYFIL